MRKALSTPEIAAELPWMLRNFMIFTPKEVCSVQTGRNVPLFNRDRFHIVVSNFRRLDCFVDNFNRMQGFDINRDRIFIFDCTPYSEFQTELNIADRLTAFGLTWGENLHFIRRRNWGVNHGAQLDYFRAIREGKISLPTYTAFIQEHYLDLEHFVKEDTIPEKSTYDLNQMEAKFRNDPEIGCAFYARKGIRVCTSNPVTKSDEVFFGDGTSLLPNARRHCFCIDGGNFIVRPELYLNWFNTHPHYLTRGDGSYGFAHVWEVRLGSILYNQKIKWADLYRNIDYRDINQLDEIEVLRGEKCSELWYDNRIWFFFYGRDIHRYLPLPFVSTLRYLIRYLIYFFQFPRDKTLQFMRPKKNMEGEKGAIRDEY